MPLERHSKLSDYDLQSVSSPISSKYSTPELSEDTGEESYSSRGSGRTEELKMTISRSEIHPREKDRKLQNTVEGYS